MIRAGDSSLTHHRQESHGWPKKRKRAVKEKNKATTSTSEGELPISFLVADVLTRFLSSDNYKSGHRAIEALRQTTVVRRRRRRRREGLPSVEGLMAGELPDSEREEVDVLTRFYISQPLDRSDQQWRVSPDVDSAYRHTSESL